ncbi:NADAR family protein [Chitinophagaceae bacterium MMS25-I14]
MKYDINWLKEQTAADVPVKYLFFWGHTQKKPGITDASCLSQWWPAAFMHEGITYATAEHWMMAQKALLFDDMEHHELILEAQKPAVAKALGRMVVNFDAETWQQNAGRIVVEGNYHKFSQNGSIKNFLLETGNKIIVEASPRDRIWGIGMGKDNPDAANPELWKGTNLLGFALMEVRDLLNNE